MSTAIGTSYNLLLPRDFDAGQLALALAAGIGVPASSVDIADRDSADRNWDAAVLCTYEPADGDIAWMLDVYVAVVVATPPSWERLAGALAGGLGQPVLYEAQSWPPTAYWMASPAGWRTRARVEELDVPDDADRPELAIQAVERPVAELPSVPVEAQPEVIRGVFPEAPVTRAWEALVPADERDALIEVRGRLGAWEQLVTRMNSGWPPDGWYPVAYYVEDLERRDELEGTHAPVADAEYRAALSRVDDEFRAATREADPDELTATYGEPVAAAKGWWWRRLPDPLPWGPGREPGIPAG